MELRLILVEKFNRTEKSGEYERRGSSIVLEPRLLRLCACVNACYLISCSNPSNSGVLKNSPRVISSPSQSFLMVDNLGSLLLPYKIFFTEEGGTADMVASL